MKEEICAAEAGRITGMRGQAIIERIKLKVPPFDTIGYCVRKEKKGNTTKNQYLVRTRKLLEYYHIPEEVAEERLKVSL